MLAVMLGQMCIAGVAEAQDSGSVIMRRPLIVRKPTGTGTPGTPGTENPSTTPGQDVPEPTSICDKGAGSPAAIPVSAAWVLDGSSVSKDSSQCSVVTQTVHCQATYACRVEGNDLTFTADAPDSTCENFPGPVSYPTIGMPGGPSPDFPPPDFPPSDFPGTNFPPIG